jgi:hypothetical protein
MKGVMNELSQPASRRSLLQKAFGVVAGALGMKMLDQETRAEEAPAGPGPGQVLSFYARQIEAHVPGQSPGRLPISNGRMNRQGELLDRPDGKKVGSFHATCFYPESPLHSSPSVASSVELQMFHLPAGTLFGMGGSSAHVVGEMHHAILGGTGRFAGVRGSYVLRHSAKESSPAGFEFVLTLIS